MKGLRSEVRQVVEREACTGCGFCVNLDGGLEMRLNEAGHLRPFEAGPEAQGSNASKLFKQACPGIQVNAQRPVGSQRHPLLGSYFGAWEAWATDPEIRLAGSSGGALTALHAWLVSTGRVARVTGAGADLENPRKTVAVTIMTRADALAAAGSRYAPVAALANPDALAPDSAVTAKPCEVAAVRASTESPHQERPLLLSFFCAGTPSQFATDQLLDKLGVGSDEPVKQMRYRGNGWPGRFVARTRDREVDADYEESWGSVLGPTTQWRCKVCADGVGESADIVSADSWATDERGYPQFVEGPGVSALIARTRRGLALIDDAIAEGVIDVRPLQMSRLADAQPLQTARRRLLLARLWGSRLARRTPPRFGAFGLIRIGLPHPRQFVRVLRGTYRRVRAARGRSV